MSGKTRSMTHLRRCSNRSGHASDTVSSTHPNMSCRYKSRSIYCQWNPTKTTKNPRPNARRPKRGSPPFLSSNYMSSYSSGRNSARSPRGKNGNWNWANNAFENMSSDHPSSAQCETCFALSACGSSKRHRHLTKYSSKENNLLSVRERQKRSV